MDRWLTIPAAAAMLLVGAALSWRMQPGAPVQPRPAPPVARGASNPNFEICLRHARLVHDVTWASACMKLAMDDEASDGSPDCTLPDWRAAPLNEALDAAENRCWSEASRPR